MTGGVFMGGVSVGLNSTLVDLGREIEILESGVKDARDYVKSTKTACDKGQADLDHLIAVEQEKRREHDEYAKFLNEEPDRGTPAMRKTLDKFNAELNDLVPQLAPAKDGALKLQSKHRDALGALEFNEKRLEQKQKEYDEITERIRKFATNN